MKTLEQERAAAAWTCVTDIKKSADLAKEKAFRSLVKDAPASIMRNGLGQTLAFWRSKAGNKSDSVHTILADELSKWLKSQLKWDEAMSDGLDWVVNKASPMEYRYATSEALAYLQWLKRFCEAKLEAGGPNESK
jgi:CRISPR-associated protein Cmr5